ncbi:MAG: hypothetical protein A2087_08890 [Spirochaetes bacterium GWD1_61_31]|nr:MAG: hypothetical protein A2Y37_13485 [Spirochaetes bacterium GWB1_60_80]OHD30058.1 MAG: hypothetical protein A2004_03555 [Spirochaetes bacterium GWC1_61_12]OHD42549.1 MAG: hypothetical protein A2087_08890 [Spirochaetes bacterium GWD1_61_31]OHD45065.1 MAG: hypothetical protein A2Y35_12705 [Spirochaetes bacterium GWE1_60_18]OHD59993.1 MAG: hypothetical protein A2Y32_14555 [Spirochaetes bacterium GWF1_60_12]HAP42962.1 hypothetical protein [Spirochaetaceae bacterium]
MPRADSANKSRLLPLTVLLALVGFGIGLVLAIINGQRQEILPHLGLFWAIGHGLVMLATWAPPILLVSACTSGEFTTRGISFASAAKGTMIPALILAGVFSLFYLFLVPPVEAKLDRYRQTSLQFNTALRELNLALHENRLEDAGRYLQVCRAIAINAPACQEATERYQMAVVRATRQVVEAEAETGMASAIAENTSDWQAGNDFYLQARLALEEGRYFDAYFLARRARALYPNRVEVRVLENLTWERLQNAIPPAELQSGRAYYARKVEGYRLLVEEEYLLAFRLFSILASERPDDPDLRTYLARSQTGLAQTYFFVDEYEAALKRYRSLPLDFNLTLDDRQLRLQAELALAGPDGIFFKNVTYRQDGADAILMGSPLARLTGNSLIPRAVQRERPAETLEPLWQSDAATGLAVLANLPFNEEDVRLVMQFSGQPGDIPLHHLLFSLDEAARLGRDRTTLQRELGLRLSYPFTMIILVLLGIALGMRFRGPNSPGPVSIVIGSPLLVLLASLPIKIFSDGSLILLNLLASQTGLASFLAAWLGMLAGVTVLCLLLAVKIAAASPV